jgi:lipopolysaccharide transport system ATP-binding protein
VVLRVENLYKQYSLGALGHGALAKDLASWWARVRGREDPNALVSPASAARNGAAGQRFWALEGVGLEVARGEALGVIGANGAGKSTLLKIISRITSPSQGRVRLRGRVASLLEVGTGFHPELSGRENIFLNGAIMGMTKAEIRRKFDEIVDFSGVEKFIDTPVKRYSSGMHVRLGFAVAAHLEPEILLVDEVLAVGDAAFQRKCLGKMGEVAHSGRTILFVSHNMSAVRNLCQRAVLLSEGRLVKDGPAAEVVQGYLAAATTDLGQLSLAERTDRNGHGRVRATSLEIRAPGRTGQPPQTGGPAEFIVGYRGEAEIARLAVALSITDVIGQPILACATYMVEADIFSAPAQGCLICEVENLPLLPSRYWLNLKLIDAHGAADQIKAAASFDVIEGEQTRFAKFLKADWGSVVVPQKWSYRPGDDRVTD